MSNDILEAEVLAAADALVAAFAEGRLDDYFGAFAPDASFVFHTTPGRIESTGAYRRLWDSWVQQDAFRVESCLSTDRRVQLLGDTAVFTHQVETCTAIGDGGGTVRETLRERETIVFDRRTGDGRWLAVHEHLSPSAG